MNPNFSDVADNEFVQLENFPDYSINKLGQIQNNSTGRILPTHFQHKYLAITLNQNSIKKSVRVHRLLADTFLLNLENKKLVDHIDRNPANNNLSNLRWCTRVENSYNMSKTKKKTSSKYKGVFKIKNNQYRAAIRKNGKLFHTGRFSTKKEAAVEYNMKVIELFGEFTVLNIINLE